MGFSSHCIHCNLTNTHTHTYCLYTGGAVVGAANAIQAKHSREEGSRGRVPPVATYVDSVLSHIAPAVYSELLQAVKTLPPSTASVDKNTLDASSQKQQEQQGSNQAAADSVSVYPLQMPTQPFAYDSEFVRRCVEANVHHQVCVYVCVCHIMIDCWLF